MCVNILNTDRNLSEPSLRMLVAEDLEMTNTHRHTLQLNGKAQILRQEISQMNYRRLSVKYSGVM